MNWIKIKKKKIVDSIVFTEQQFIGQLNLKTCLTHVRVYDCKRNANEWIRVLRPTSTYGFRFCRRNGSASARFKKRSAKNLLTGRARKKTDSQRI